jgi:phospholipid/cholesterol/gamma-HCH transport system substrate-binding protein
MNPLLEFRELDSRFEKLNFRTGLFIALALALLAAAVAGTLLRQGVLTQTSNLYFFSESAAGITRGMSVQLSGFKIGTVEEIALEPDTRVKTRLVVKSEYMRHITQDSEARLAKEGLIGASIIEIVPKSKELRTIPNNGVLQFERAGDFAVLAEALADKLHPILDDVKKITESANDPQGDIRATLRNVREATAAVAQLQVELNRLARTVNERTDTVTAQVGKVLERADGAIAKADGAIGTLNGTLSTLDKQLPETLLRLERTLANVEGATADARRIAAGLASDVPPAVSQGRALMEDTREIVDGARRSWPIRGFLVEPLERPLPLDSHDGAGRP